MKQHPNYREIGKYDLPKPYVSAKAVVGTIISAVAVGLFVALMAHGWQVSQEAKLPVPCIEQDGPQRVPKSDAPFVDVMPQYPFTPRVLEHEFVV